MKSFFVVLCFLAADVYSATLPAEVSRKHEALFSKLKDYRLVRPYRSTADGEFLTYDLSTNKQSEFQWVHDEFRSKRSNELGGALNADESEPDTPTEEEGHYYFVVDVFGNRIKLNLTKNGYLFAPSFGIDWFEENGQVIEEDPPMDCFYEGSVNEDLGSVAAISTCDGLSGVIMSGDEEFVIEPVETSHDAIVDDFTYKGTHVIYKTQDNAEFNNPLLHDTIQLISEQTPHDDTDDVLWEDDDAPQAGITSRRQQRSISDRAHYVEMMIAADHSMYEFHGKTLPTYIGTMMNILNLAYSHHSLGMKMKLVLTKITVLNEEQSKSILVGGNADATLANFFSWAAINKPDDPASPDYYDLAAFVSRKSFGPAGYAPVGEMCSRKYSCALIEDSGLLTSYVIAHEVGHVLGMEHDSGEKHCGKKADVGSIMAPIVTSTYNNYFWSECSVNDLQQHLQTYSCLLDDPFVIATTAKFPPGARHTVNDQCEFDFGRESFTCSTLDEDTFCENLWCYKPDDQSGNCYSKNGPPLDGTSCGQGKWCMQGKCEVIKTLYDGIWSEWGAWGACSYSCGIGVSAKIRKCDNPPPLAGGRDCEGESEQIKLCNTQQCEATTDRRAEQCRGNLENWVYREQVHTWLPFQNPDRELHCRLTCVSQETGDIVVSQYNVIDGTPCTYENQDEICMQGECVPVGCDKVLFSEAPGDHCGVCGGDNSTCQFIEETSKLMPKRANTYKKLAKIPKGAMNLVIEKITDSPNFLALRDAEKGGKHILNGDREVVGSHEIIFDNTRFIYRRYGPESITTSGPISKELQLQVYVTDKTSSVDARWSYYIQTARSLAVTTYTWEPIGWTECSENCGGGFSYYIYQCKRTSDNATVGDNLCDHEQYVNLNMSKSCNEAECGPPPSYEWYSETWSPCSITCGGEGMRTRGVVCSDLRRESEVIIQATEVHENVCEVNPKPVTSEACNRGPCALEWATTSWSECSATCGKGIQTRKVSCDNPTNTEINFRCDQEKPPTMEPCILKDCPPGECRPLSEGFCGMISHETLCSEMQDYASYCCVDCS